MTSTAPAPCQLPSSTEARTPSIRIAAALIDDDDGRLLLVRKAGTGVFMQAGGKIEPGETAVAALRRELLEEIGFALADADPAYLGRLVAPAANEPGCLVEAELFHIRASFAPEVSAEIAEAGWFARDEAITLPLAPLTRDRVLPLAATLAGQYR
ncbi:NUDIX domain-containing protein [Sphingosinicella sp. BN140058]|uniref:NUDIX hydrolase n=1 Tax=Sphingosinicella sp. BN140058 TaxID=1892855 RepID=UPI0010105FF6|nr:NUDIX domain-containing protein [Sphingosinicella sp. BN140058]QAY79033.1 NUDIX domain-containing protein [Sphingosinicella sp. BN140058]